jgi:hypothetical protein
MTAPKLKPMADAPSDWPVILYRQPLDFGQLDTLVVAFWSESVGEWVWPDGRFPIDFYNPDERVALVASGDFFSASSHEFIGWTDAPLAEGDQPQPPESVEGD